MSEIRLPSLGAEMDEGTLLEWYVKPGDRIEYGEVIALLDTEKAEIEMEAFEAGTIEALLIDPGQTIAVGEPVARLVDSLGAAPSAAPDAPSPNTAPATTPSPVAEPPPTEPPPTQPSRTPPADRTRATPLARRLARERGIDLSRLHGSGPHGAIVEADVPITASAPSGAERVPPAAMPSAPAAEVAHRQAAGVATDVPTRTSETPKTRAARDARRRSIIAAAMTRSKREIPHYYLSTEIEVDRALAWLAQKNLGRAAHERFVLPALLMRAVALAAKRFPEMNGHWIDGIFHPSESVDLGMVVSLRSGGIIVPTFKNADQRAAEDLLSELLDVVKRARAGRLRSGELGEASLTITNLGEDGADTIFGVIYPPQVAIVGFGGIHAALRAEGDLHGTRSVLRATLAGDHRASDGLYGSRFLKQIAENLNELEER